MFLLGNITTTQLRTAPLLCVCCFWSHLAALTVTRRLSQNERRPRRKIQLYSYFDILCLSFNLLQVTLNAMRCDQFLFMFFPCHHSARPQ